MNKYLIKLADHLDKKGLHKEADYVDWIIKNADEKRDLVFKNEKMQCVNLFNALGMSASINMKTFVEKRDAIIKLKENGGREIKEILKDFDKKLAGAYYFAIKGATDDALQKKFKMSGKDAKNKIKEIMEACSTSDGEIQ